MFRSFRQTVFKVDLRFPRKTKKATECWLWVKALDTAIRKQLGLTKLTILPSFFFTLQCLCSYWQNKHLNIKICHVFNNTSHLIHKAVAVSYFHITGKQLPTVKSGLSSSQEQQRMNKSLPEEKMKNVWLIWTSLRKGLLNC